MDITYYNTDGKFNYRVCGIMIKDGRVLAMQDSHSDYFYFPGGRVHLHERAEDALVREFSEEMGFFPEIIRPLWVCQNYFHDPLRGTPTHEIGIYFLVSADSPALVSRGDSFTRRDELGDELTFSWLPVAELGKYKIFPHFLSEQLQSLPSSLELITEKQI